MIYIYIYIYIDIYKYIYVYTYICIYIYIYNSICYHYGKLGHRAPASSGQAPRPQGNLLLEVLLRTLRIGGLGNYLSS